MGTKKSETETQTELAQAAPAAKARKKPERESFPTAAADWRGPHSTRILGRIERSVEPMPAEIRKEQRAMLLAAFTRALDAGCSS
jgi:hypothetical protein